MLRSLLTPTQRRALYARPGITPRPTCPRCQQQIAPAEFAAHTTVCHVATPAPQRLLAVRAGAKCQHCQSTAVAWYRPPRTNTWALYQLVTHPSPTVSGLYLDPDQPHQCPPAKPPVSRRAALGLAGAAVLGAVLANVPLARAAAGAGLSAKDREVAAVVAAWRRTVIRAHGREAWRIHGTFITDSATTLVEAWPHLNTETGIAGVGDVWADLVGEWMRRSAAGGV